MSEMEKMISKFLCPGCTSGRALCAGVGRRGYETQSFGCANHSAGTIIGGVGTVFLGLPKGFNRVGTQDKKYFVRLWVEGDKPEWDHLNVPVWAMVEEEFLFVRTYSPRANQGYVDVIEKGTLELVPKAWDVSKFIETID